MPVKREDVTYKFLDQRKEIDVLVEKFMCDIRRIVSPLADMPTGSFIVGDIEDSDDYNWEIKSSMGRRLYCQVWFLLNESEGGD